VTTEPASTFPDDALVCPPQPLQGEAAMAGFIEDDRPAPKRAHEIGQDLSQLSVAEIDERVALLEAEIARLGEARLKKTASRSAADAFFRKRD
jgi:uncharacterized small protein (DUF1192 family)